MSHTTTARRKLERQIAALEIVESIEPTLVNALERAGLPAPKYLHGMAGYKAEAAISWEGVTISDVDAIMRRVVPPVDASEWKAGCIYAMPTDERQAQDAINGDARVIPFRWRLAVHRYGEGGQYTDAVIEWWAVVAGRRVQCQAAVPVSSAVTVEQLWTSNGAQRRRDGVRVALRGNSEPMDHRSYWVSDRSSGVSATFTPRDPTLLPSDVWPGGGAK